MFLCFHSRQFVMSAQFLEEVVSFFAQKLLYCLLKMTFYFDIDYSLYMGSSASFTTNRDDLTLHCSTSHARIFFVTFLLLRKFFYCWSFFTFLCARLFFCRLLSCSFFKFLTLFLRCSVLLLLCFFNLFPLSPCCFFP